MSWERAQRKSRKVGGKLSLRCGAKAQAQVWAWRYYPACWKTLALRLTVLPVKHVPLLSTISRERGGGARATSPTTGSAAELSKGSGSRAGLLNSAKAQAPVPETRNALPTLQATTLRGAGDGPIRLSHSKTDQPGHTTLQRV